jgi:HSP20 family protein
MKTLVKRNHGFFPEIPSFFDEFLNKDWFDMPTTGFMRENTLPAVNIKEDENSFELEVAAPGMKKDDFKLELDNNQLSIFSEKQEEKEEKEENYTRREFSYTSFHRSFNLPENKVDGNKISANYKDGILHIVIPKKEEAKKKGPKMIKIA